MGIDAESEESQSEMSGFCLLVAEDLDQDDHRDTQDAPEDGAGDLAVEGLAQSGEDVSTPCIEPPGPTPIWIFGLTMTFARAVNAAAGESIIAPARAAVTIL